jgi:hypothetical protein
VILESECRLVTTVMTLMACICFVFASHLLAISRDFCADEALHHDESPMSPGYAIRSAASVAEHLDR